MKPSHAHERERSTGLFGLDSATAGPDRLIATVLGWLVAGIGALILFGWVADIPVLRNPVPGQIEVKANTAIGFLLSGLALGFSTWRKFRPLARAFAGVVAAGSLVILLQYPAGQSWGVDEWLFPDVENAVGTVHPGRMAAPTAVNFVLVGTALLLLGTGRVRTVALLALATCGVAVMAFTGTLYSIPALDAFGPYTSMAAPTGVTFLLLGTGVFLAGGARLAGEARRHGLLIGFVGALLLLLLLGGAVLRNIRLLAESNRQVVHTHEVLAKLDALLLVIQDLETGTRGFLLTGDEQFLEPAQPAPAQAEQHLRELQRLVADNAHQQQRLARLDQLVAAKLRVSNRQTELRRQGAAAAAEAQALVAAGEGKRVMDAIRDEVAAAIAEEHRLLGERRLRTDTDTAKTLLALGSGLAACVAILVAVYRRLRREIAVQSRLTAALRRSEESLAVTLHSIGDGVLATDTDGKITLLNPVAEALTGWTQAEARGRPVAEVFNIIHEETRAPATIPVEKVLATGEAQELANHTALIARDGRERAIADSAAPIRDAEGRILGVVLVFRDVTEARRAQAQLDRFFELSLDFLCIASGDGTFKRVSPAVTDVLGLSVEEFLATPYMEQVHPDDRAATQREVERQMKAGEKVFHFENRYRHKDGSWRTLSWRSAPHGDLMYATARDVTESRRAQAQLDQFFELSLDFLCIASLDGWFKRASPAVTDILGWSVEEFLAMPYLEQIHPDDRASAMEEVQRQAAGQKVMHYECRFRHKDGSWRLLAWRSAPYGGFMYATARDVTEARRAEQQIRTLNNVLAQRAAQLEAANKELEAFSYSVSHDLRAPLRHVQGYVEMLDREAQDNLSEKGRRYLRTIADAAREMGTLIDDLLSFSRMGRTEMRETEVEPGLLVEEVRRNLAPDAAGREIRWTVAPLPRVRADAAMLRQVLANLLGNAVKYTRKRPVAEIEIGCASTEGDRRVFFVRDNGAGFDMKYADKLFGVFQRLHRADEFEGTGIGLANVRRIIGRHGGRTWAEGRPDGGATFYFTLQDAQASQATDSASL
jgi:PAS domain S-box-containing protein